MDNERVSFNLIDEPWIRACSLTGEVEEYSLLGLFECAPKLQALKNDIPTQDFAILRVLLAIMQRAISPELTDDDDPAEVWGELWRAEALPMEKIRLYFEKWYSRFDLFDCQKPFMQVARLEPLSGNVSEIKKIIADVPDGNAFFTMKSGKSLEVLSYAEATRWLIHAQAYDTAGIKSGVVGDSSTKGGKSYPIGTGWAGKLGGLFIEGQNLRETIILNLILCSDQTDEVFSPDDLPVWEREYQDDDIFHSHTPTGRIDLYTWQARRVLLHPSNDGVDGVVFTNGDKLEPQNMMRVEPMTGWRRSPTQEKKLNQEIVYMPFEHHADRALWRGLDSILPIDEQTNPDKLPPASIAWVEFLSSSNGGKQFIDKGYLRIHAVGFEYGSQSSTFHILIDDTLDLHAGLITPDGRPMVELARECVEVTDKAILQFGYFAKNLYIASGGDAQDSATERRARAEAYYEIDRAFRNWLANLNVDSDPEAVRREWYEKARTILYKMAQEIVKETNPAAFVGKETQKGAWMTAGKAEALFYRSLSKILSVEISEKHEK